MREFEKTAARFLLLTPTKKLIHSSSASVVDTMLRVMVLIEEVETGERRWYDAGVAHKGIQLATADDVCFGDLTQ